MVALEAEDLLAWVERTSTGWQDLLAAHPELLALPCNVAQTSSVAELLQHIVAVELRDAERLHGLPVTPYEEIDAGSSGEIYATHNLAIKLLRELLPHDEAWWSDSIDLTTRRGDKMRATRRVIFVHSLMHAIRHYAQLATLVRQHGVPPGWPMDYIFLSAKFD